MIYKNNGNYLTVTSNIYFDENVFCGRPYVHLLAIKDKPFYKDYNYYIQIAIHDNDDFDIGLIYETNKDNFTKILHELINWMIDHEKGISSYKKLLNPFEFFPKLDCEIKL